MRLLSARLILSLILAITLVSLFSAYNQVRGERRSLRNDLERRAAVLADSLAGNVEPYLESGALQKLQVVVDRFSNREHLAGVSIFNDKLEPIAQSSGLAQRMQSRPAVIAQVMASNQKQSAFVQTGSGSLRIYALPLNDDGKEGRAVLAIVHEASYIHTQTARLW